MTEESECSYLLDPCVRVQLAEAKRLVEAARAKKEIGKKAIARSCIEAASSCGDHKIGFDWEDVAWVLAACEMDEADRIWNDTDSFAVLALRDGRGAVVWEWSDSTGHGCQCEGGASFYDTPEQALSLGLTDEQRERVRASD